MTIQQYPSYFLRSCLILAMILAACQHNPTAVPSPFPTILPTPTLLPANVAITEPEKLSLPTIPNDLIFLQDGQLKIWRHDQGIIEPFIQGSHADEIVQEYTLSADKTHLMVHLILQQATPLHTFRFIDLATNQTFDLLTQVPCLLDYALLIEGQKIVYVIDDWLEDEQVCASRLNRQFAYLEETDIPKARAGTIYVANWSENNASVIGECHSTIPDDWLPNLEYEGQEFVKYRADCSIVGWLHNGKQFLSLDAQGLWIHNVEETSSKLLSQHPAFLPEEEYDTFYSNGSISPSGNYVLILAFDPHGDGGRRSIINLVTGAEFFPPDQRDAFFYTGNPWPTWQWQENDQLLKTANGSPPTITLFDAKQTILTQIESLALPNMGANVIGSPYIKQDGSLLFVVSNGVEEQSHEQGIYKLTNWHSQLQKLSDSPSINSWQDGFIINESSHETILLLSHWAVYERRMDYWLVNVENNTLILLNEAMGENTRLANWLP